MTCPAPKVPYQRPTEETIAAFWDCVDIRGPDECWMWQKGTSPAGYGLWWRLRHRTRWAHRLAWEFHHDQPIPPGLIIRHHCDTPGCVNPKHLAVGTHADNLADARTRGRLRQGSRRNPNLDEADVYEARHLHFVHGLTVTRCAEVLGLSLGFTSELLRGIWWRHVPMPPGFAHAPPRDKTPKGQAA